MAFEVYGITTQGIIIIHMNLCTSGAFRELHLYMVQMYMYCACTCTLYLEHVHEERLGNTCTCTLITGSHPGLNRGPLTLAVSALPPELCRVTASLHNSQYHSVCAIRIPLGIDQ